MVKIKKSFILFILIIFLSLIFFYTKSSDNHEEDEGNHIHTIVFDPADKNSIYVGTHDILERYDNNKKEEIGNYGEDYMGLIISSDGSFYSSGHSSEIPNVGIRRSYDKGKTWQILAYEGTDFHQMITSYNDPNVIYAWATPPDEFLTLSKDAGKTWNKVNVNIGMSIFALAADHQKANKLYVGTLSGFYVSEDYGETWNEIQSLSKTPIVVVADDPKLENVMYVSAYKQGILKTTDDGATWNSIDEGLPVSTEDIVVLLTINPHNSTEIYALTKNGVTFRYDGYKWSSSSIFD